VTAIYRKSPGRGTWALGLSVGLAGLTLFVAGIRDIATVLNIAGLVLMLRGCSIHDNAHRETGDSGHVLWGPGDKSRPTWLARR
jgi:hypothetical protein